MSRFSVWCFGVLSLFPYIRYITKLFLHVLRFLTFSNRKLQQCMFTFCVHSQNALERDIEFKFPYGSLHQHESRTVRTGHQEKIS